MQSFPSSGHVHITIWMHHKDAEKSYGEKVWQQLHKNATFHKSAAIRPPNSHLKNLQIWWTRHAGLCWRSKDNLISNALLWTPSHRRANVRWLAETYLRQLCVNTGCSLEDLSEVMENRNEWQERVRVIHVSGMLVLWYMYIWLWLKETIFN